MANATTDTAVKHQPLEYTHESSVARKATFSDFYDVYEMLGKYVPFFFYLLRPWLQHAKTLR